MANDATKKPTATTDASAEPVPDVAPDGATRAVVRVGPDGTAMVGGTQVRFGRSLAGALVTVEAE